MYDVVVKNSRLLSHLLRGSLFYNLIGICLYDLLTYLMTEFLRANSNSMPVSFSMHVLICFGGLLPFDFF